MRFGFWSRASTLAARTPEERNRYVDFLRAVSIGAVVLGHWLVAAVQVENGTMAFGKLLEYQSWTHWLTWVFQVMPVFFMVGGFSNSASWSSARRDSRDYGVWLHGRLQRLVGPVLPLLLVWAVLGAAAQGFGLESEVVKVGSQSALIPVWFLAVYVMVVVMVPVTRAAWERFGFMSFWVLVVAAAVDDLLFFAVDLRWLGWLNYGFIWLAVHQLGYAWRDGRLTGLRKTLPWAVGGLAVLVGLVSIGPYPTSLVSVPGSEISNTLPPKLPLLALGVLQCGLFLSLEAPLRRWLRRAAPWTATVLVNSMIMTVFLWHLTAMSLTVGLSWLAGGKGLGLAPGSTTWWLTRPLWVALLSIVLLLFGLVFSRFERSTRRSRPIAGWRPAVGATLVCAGLSFLALGGVAGEGWLGLRLWVLLLPFVGAALAGVTPIGRRTA
jgi:hypothetical protein